MSQGLQIWDAGGALTVDLTTRLTRILGSFTTTQAVNASASIVDAKLLEGTPWYSIQQTPSSRPWLPIISVSGDTITWSTRGGASVTRSVTVIYGVY